MKLIALIYKKFIDFRNFMYDKNKFASYKSSIPVVSIGNITVGGTGKTPFVIYLVKLFEERGLNPLIISRGYKRKTKNQVFFNSNSGKSIDDVGDEPFLISLLCPNIDIIVNKNRVEAVRWAEKSKIKYDVIILDDGFQHRALERDFNVLLMNSNQNISDCLPYGQLREPLKNINRADCIVFTKSSSLANISPVISSSNIPIFKSNESFKLVGGDSDSGVAFCGIGDPSSFIKILKKLSIKVAGSIYFKDHQQYNALAIKKIETLLLKNNQQTFFTTHKDWIKLPPSFLKKYRGTYIEMEVGVQDSSFHDLLKKKINLN